MKEYLKAIKEKSVILKDFKTTEITSLSAMEGIVNASRGSKSYFAIDNTIDGEISQDSGYNDNRFITVYILDQINRGNRETAIEKCKKAFKSIVKRIIRDRNMLMLENIHITPRFSYYEIPEHLFDDLTGVYFNIYYTIPESLIYEPSEFTD